MKYVVTINGKKYEVEVEKVGTENNNKAVVGKVDSASKSATIVSKQSASKSTSVNGQQIKAPMPGTILDVKVTQGAQVKTGDVLFILEAMKMENEIVAEVDGTVQSIEVSKGSKVANGDIMAVIQ